MTKNNNIQEKSGNLAKYSFHALRHVHTKRKTQNLLLRTKSAIEKIRKLNFLGGFGIHKYISYARDGASRKSSSQILEENISISCKSIYMKGGEANAGIIKHVFSTSGSTGENGEFFLVEKRLRRIKAFEAEFDLCRRISAISNIGIEISPLPNIICAIELEKYYSVIMPFYKGANIQLKDQNLHAKIIAKAVSKFNSSKLIFPKINKMNQLIDIVKKDEFNKEEYTKFSRSVINFCCLKNKEFPKDEIVMSHNDLYFPNIATGKCMLGYNIVFIDLGHVSYNQVGADFHHFLRAGILNQSNMIMAENVIEEYSKIINKDVSLIAFNAYRFSLLRVAGRLRMHIARKNQKKFAKELEVGWGLHKSAISTFNN